MRKKIIAFAGAMLSALSFLGALFLSLCLPADAQQPGKIPTIGFMRGGSPTDPEVEAFRQGLRELVTSRETTSSLNSEIRKGRRIVLPALRRSWSV